MAGRRVLLLAGEESGALYAREIAAKMLERDPSVEIRGYGDYGFEIHDLAVMGFFAVLSRIFFFMRVRRTMERAIDEWKPDLVCTVDYPGMNMRLAAHAKSKGVRTVHVVCPQVWAWRAWRIPKIEAALDRLCCFFPFEPSIFKPGFAAFVGHPLVDAFNAKSIVETAASGARKTVALLPGSRMREIKAILPTLLDAVRGLDVDLAIPAANDGARREIDRIISARRDGVAVRVQSGGARELLLKSDCAVVASGTATLEAALARCPTVLVYRVGFLTAAILRRAIKGVKHVGLANVIWEKCMGGAANADPGEAPMPELLQENFTAQNVRRYLDMWLSDAKARDEAVRRLDDAMSYLRSGGDAIARIAVELE